LIQLAAYLIVAIVVLLVRLRNFRHAKRKSEDGAYTLWEWFVMGCRTLSSSVFAGAAMLCGAKALMLFENLPVLAMMPVRIFLWSYADVFC